MGSGSFALKRRAALAGATLFAVCPQTQTAFTDIGRLHPKLEKAVFVYVYVCVCVCVTSCSLIIQVQ